MGNGQETNSKAVEVYRTTTSIIDYVYSQHGQAWGGTLDADGPLNALASTWDREEGIQSRIAELNSLGPDITEEERNEREVLQYAIENINEVRSELSDDEMEEYLQLGTEGLSTEDAVLAAVLAGPTAGVGTAAILSGAAAAPEFIDPNDPRAVAADSQRVAAAENDFTQLSGEGGIPEGLDPGEGSQMVRTAYQCYLLYHADYFSSVHKNLLASDEPIAKTGYRGVHQDADDGLFALKTKGYWSDHLSAPRILLTNEAEDGTLLMNRLNTCTGSDQFVNIRPDEYASLVPYLKLFKVYRNLETTGDSAMVEFEFPNSTNTDGIRKGSTVSVIPPAGPAENVSSRGNAVGVKSFEWKFLGTDPFTATRDVQATLKLRFQHFSQLVEQRTGPNLYETEGLEVTYKYLDLIIQPDCRQAEGSPSSPGSSGAYPGRKYNRIYKPECYEIRVDVGYYDPPAKSKTDPGLKAGVCCQRQSLFLVLTDHAFDLQQDGTFELTISFRGRLEGVMRDKKFNVLMPGGGFAEVYMKDPQTGNNVSIQNIEKELIEIKQGEETEAEKSEIKELEKLQERFYNKHKQLFYDGIVATLLTYGMVHGISLSPDEYFSFMQWKVDDLESELPPRKSALAIDITNGAKELLKDESQSIAEGSISGIRLQYEEDEEELKNQLNSDQFKDRLQNHVQNENYDINYVFLGDLIAVVTANTLGEASFAGTYDNSLSRMNQDYSIIYNASREALGPVLGADMVPGTDYDVLPSIVAAGYILTQDKPFMDVSRTNLTGLGEIVDRFRLILGNIRIIGADEEEKLINLAHVPVSLEMLQAFMVKNVLTQNRTYYSYFDFLDDLLSEIVTEILSGDCFGGFGNLDSSAGTGLVTTHKNILESDTFWDASEQEGYMVLKPELSNPSTPIFKSCYSYPVPGNTPQPFDYFALYTKETAPRNLAGVWDPEVLENNRGDNLGDRERGIQHFHFGMDRGILKNASFRKTDQEYLPEARFANEGNFVFNQLSNVYDVDFNMFGNTLFSPGQYVYFDPSSVGAGKPWQYKKDAEGEVVQRSWANIMGLGGYHLITEVAHSITPGKFDTTVKARWVTGGENKSVEDAE